MKAAGRIREVARELDLGVGNIGLVINQAPPDVSPLKKAIEACGVPLWHTIPGSERILQNDVVAGSVFSLPDDDPAVKAAGELVEKIISR